MKRYTIITILAALLLSNIFNQLKAQVTIGSEAEPDNNALLDLKEDPATGESVRGMLLPRVNLVSLTDPSPLVSHVEGIMVYNLKNDGVGEAISPGLYKNNGTRWVRMLLPDGGQEGQVLEIDPATMSPKWVTKYVPPADEVGEFSLTKTEAFKDENGNVLPQYNDNGGHTYAENSTLHDGQWRTIIEPINIDATKSNNKLILFFQTTLIQSSYYAGGSLSYAAGLFLDGELKGVRVSVIASAADGSDPVQKTETLFFVLENLQPGSHTIDIAFKRRTPSNAGLVPALHIGQPLGNTPGSTSVSYEFYEQN